MHGDFAPWNLRRTGPGELVLVDWEDAAYGPPGADEVFYQACQAALGMERATGSPHAEAIDYWLRRLQQRTDGGRDQRLAAATVAALRRVDVRGSADGVVRHVATRDGWELPASTTATRHRP